MGDMQIRRAEPADRDAVIATWEAAGLTRPWNDPVLDFDRALAGATSTILVGVDDSTVIATAMVGEDGHRGWVYYLAVREDARGRGLGREMMAAVEDWLRAAGAVKVQLMVRESNAGVIGFYEALGYTDDQVRVLGRRL
jgi:ribosomal protein S18 acetylase RimI-like enzyme